MALIGKKEGARLMKGYRAYQKKKAAAAAKRKRKSSSRYIQKIREFF